MTDTFTSEDIKPIVDVGYDEPRQGEDARQEGQLEMMWGRLPNDRWKNVGRMVQIKVVSDEDVLSTGDSKFVFLVPPELDGVKLVRVIGMVSTVSSSGAITVQVRNITQTTDVLSTALTIDASELTSLTAATAAVIKTTMIFRSGNLVAIDVDGAGTGTKGLTIHLSFI